MSATSGELQIAGEPQVHAVRIYHLGGFLWLRSWRIYRANSEMDLMLRSGWSVVGALSIGSCLIVHYMDRGAAAGIILQRVAEQSDGSAEKPDTQDWGLS